MLGRKPADEVRSLFEGHGYEVIEVSGDDLPGMHHRFAGALGHAYRTITGIQESARSGRKYHRRPRWPMIILRSPKGWTGPSEVDGVKVTGTWRSHQVPLAGVRENPEHLQLLENWLRSYRPEELFNESGFPTDLYRRNPRTFRLFCPDETNSNRLGSVFDVSDRAFMERVTPDDVKISSTGRVMDVLSEHSCHGWLEGYTLTGRHGLFATYEAFAMVSASQTIQHSKWLEEASRLSWRAKVPSLNVLLTSTAWRNDHNGFSHQGPGLIQIVITHRGEVSRVYLPPDANCLLAVADHCLRSRSYVNLIVIDKQPQLQWLPIDQAIEHCARGASIWTWAGNDDGSCEPDIVLACAGDVVAMETVAAAQMLQEHLPQLRVRVVNVVDLMALIRPKDHPHGMSEVLFSELFTDSVNVVFAFHGFPGAVHQLIHGRPRYRPLPRSRIHRAGNHNHPVRHDSEESSVPLPLSHGRYPQLPAYAARLRRSSHLVCEETARARGVRHRASRRSARHQELDFVAAATEPLEHPASRRRSARDLMQGLSGLVILLQACI